MESLTSRDPVHGRPVWIGASEGTTASAGMEVERRTKRLREAGGWTMVPYWGVVRTGGGQRLSPTVDPRAGAIASPLATGSSLGTCSRPQIRQPAKNNAFELGLSVGSAAPWGGQSRSDLHLRQAPLHRDTGGCPMSHSPVCAQTVRAKPAPDRVARFPPVVGGRRLVRRLDDLGQDAAARRGVQEGDAGAPDAHSGFLIDQ